MKNIEPGKVSVASLILGILSPRKFESSTLGINGMRTLCCLSFLGALCLAPITGHTQDNELPEDFELHERCETDLASEGRNYPSFQPYHCPDTSEGVFNLRQDFPTEIADEHLPWKDVDFKSESERYADIVLQYAFEGNIQNDFDVQKNVVRDWYHAPWQHHDSISCGNGREYHHGLTRERPIPPFEFHDDQTDDLEAWAIGFYNQTGAVTLGNVWPGFGEDPDVDAAEFAEGTVAFKLLFTDAGPNGDVERQLPFLDGTVQWTANIYPIQPYPGHSRREHLCFNDGREKRIDRPVYLTQIDIAVKDDRSPVGWVFGTFLYNANKADAWESSDPVFNQWNRFDVVGLSWGDDSDVSLMKNMPGAFVNPALQETWLNPELIAVQSEVAENQAYMKFHGLGGRLNGPVDNPVSSCMSCHGRAGLARNDLTVRHPMGIWETWMEKTSTRATINQDVFERYFGFMPPGGRSDGGYVFFDYSMQVAFGIQNRAKMDVLRERVQNEGVVLEALPFDLEVLNPPGISGIADRGGSLNDLIE